MTLLEYVRDYLPQLFGVNPEFGKVTELIYYAEQADAKLFADEKFNSPRERAELAIPYQVRDLKKREHALNVIELIIIKHRQEKHGEDWQSRMDEIKEQTQFTEQEAQLIARPEDWWSG